MILPLLLAAAGFQDTAGLDRAVAAFTGKGVGDEGGARTPVDARLRLAQCPTVALSWRTAAHDAVVVACSGPDWRIFVPVRRAAPPPAAMTRPAVAAAVPRAEAVIRRGDPIVVEAGGEGFAISREGVAMGDAAPGARLLVRIGESRAPIQALAVEPGKATLPGGL